MNLHERLQIFYGRLRAAPPAASAHEALDLIRRLIVEVEMNSPAFRGSTRRPSARRGACILRCRPPFHVGHDAVFDSADEAAEHLLTVVAESLKTPSVAAA